MREFCKLFRSVSAVALILVGFSGAQLLASDVGSVTGMLKSASENGDRTAFETILKMALQTWPSKQEKLLAAAEGVNKTWMLAEQTEQLLAIRKAAKDAEEASKARGIIYYIDPVLWNTQVELGAGSSTGDTSEKAVALGVSFNRAFGDAWEHELDLDFDFASSEGSTTRQKFHGKYEALWRIWDDLYAVNYTDLELDRFSGYDYRVLENLGVGYKLFDTKRHSLRFEGGPAVRFSKLDTDFLDEPFPEDLTDTELLGRISTTYNLKLSDNMSFRDKASATVSSESTTFNNLAEFAAQINSHLTARLSVEAGYDSASPLGTSAWDTSTRVTLVYGF